MIYLSNTFVNIGRSPPNARVEPERQTLMQGTSGELRCIVSGIPKPTVTWSKVGADLSNRHTVVILFIYFLVY